MPTVKGIFRLPEVIVILKEMYEELNEMIFERKITVVNRDNHNFRHDHMIDQPNRVFV